jgi:hypothetical protein
MAGSVELIDGQEFARGVAAMVEFRTSEGAPLVTGPGERGGRDLGAYAH